MSDTTATKPETTKNKEPGPVWGCSGDNTGTVKTENGHLYFYAPVGDNFILDLSTQLRALVLESMQIAIKFDVDPPPIKLHIKSYGGSCFSGFFASNLIQDSKVPVWTIIDGAAASAATLISISGARRFITRNSYMLIHQLSAMSFGNFEQLKDQFTNHSRLMDTIKQLYTKFTKLEGKHLDKVLKHDLWMTAEECLEFGLVDEII